MPLETSLSGQKDIHSNNNVQLLRFLASAVEVIESGGANGKDGDVSAGVWIVPPKQEKTVLCLEGQHAHVTKSFAILITFSISQRANLAVQLQLLLPSP
eukprot:4765098-Amphidinium_carterae.1